MMQFTCFADVYLSWMPVWRGIGLGVLLLICVGLWGAVRLVWGPSRVHGRLGLWILRGAALAILGAILLGPTIVEQQPGAIDRAQVTYLLDGSQSMAMGKEVTRWETALGFISEAQRSAGEEYCGDSEAFRFGHRLEPLQTKPAAVNAASPASDAAATAEPAAIVPVSTGEHAGALDGEAGRVPAIAPPDASDSRLADALRQLLPLLSGRSSAGVVLLSDGRVRASESAEHLAQLLGDAGVPLHVVPLGEATGSGDIAVVSLVVPPRIRKYTEDEVQVFLRSYGFTGQRTTVRLVRRSELDRADGGTLASVPITLSGGAQSASLPFRVHEQPEDLVVVVDPLEGELTERNNRVETRVEIDRTKVRVLYIEEGSLTTAQLSTSQRLFSLGSGPARFRSGGSTTVQAALQADVDIECIVLRSLGGSAPRGLAPGSGSAPLVFPKTRAELFAYDCIVFSNVGPQVLEEQHREWLAQWIAGRGGGLIVTGSPALTATAWQGSPQLLSLLPVEIGRSPATDARSTEIDVVKAEHPIWQLQLEQGANDRLLEQMPPLEVGESDVQVKPNTDVLAINSASGAAVIAAHRAGRGRVLVSTAALGDASMSQLADSWGPQPERVAGKFWRNIVYWATEGSSTGRRRLVARSDKQFYRPGEPLTIFATAYNEAALRTQDYQLWAMCEPASLDDMTLYSPILWPDDVVRESGEASPRIAWGEELPLVADPGTDGYALKLMLSEAGEATENGLRIEMTAYEGGEPQTAFGHGTQIDSTSLAIQILSDPFEQQNPLPNHELLERLAAVSGGHVLRDPKQLADLLKNRQQTTGPPKRELSPAWSQWWLWMGLLGLISAEWVWRRVTGLA